MLAVSVNHVCTRRMRMLNHREARGRQLNDTASTLAATHCAIDATGVRWTRRLADGRWRPETGAGTEGHRSALAFRGMAWHVPQPSLPGQQGDQTNPLIDRQRKEGGTEGKGGTAAVLCLAQRGFAGTGPPG